MLRLHKKDRILWAIAFVLAIITYIYVQDLMNAKPVRDSSYNLLKLTAKSVPVKVRFASNPPAGFRLIAEKVRVRPDHIVVVGPEALLEETSTAETAILDISQSTRKQVKSTTIESVAGYTLKGEPFQVEVIVPIEKIEVKQ